MIKILHFGGNFYYLRTIQMIRNNFTGIDKILILMHLEKIVFERKIRPEKYSLFSLYHYTK